MKKLLLPFTILVGAVSAVAGAVLFAKNKKVQTFVKDSSGKLLDELKVGVAKAKDKLSEVKTDEKNEKFVNFLRSTVTDLSAKLDKADKKQLNASLDQFADNVNKAVDRFEEIKEAQIDPRVESAMDSLKELKEKLNRK